MAKFEVEIFWDDPLTELREIRILGSYDTKEEAEEAGKASGERYYIRAIPTD